MNEDTTDTAVRNFGSNERRIAANRNAAVTRIVQLVYFLTGALGVLLLRVVLRLLAITQVCFWPFKSVCHSLTFWKPVLVGQ